MSSSPTESAQAPVEVSMPQMGISVAEGTILEWRKAVGDEVAADETICDVTTDKVDVEIPAPASGVVTKILVEAGKTVSVGTVLAELNGEPVSDQSALPAGPVDDLAPPRSTPPAGDAAELDRSSFHSPVVRRIAAEHGVDLGRVQGSGVGGRVRKADLAAYLQRLQSGAAEARSSRPLHTESPYQPEPETAGANGNSDFEADTSPATERREVMSPMRRQIADHMVASRQTSAHCTTIVEVDFTAVASRRAAQRDAMAQRGVKLTYLAFVAEATVAALAEHQVLNASVYGNEIVYHDEIHLGIAVALEEGLIVPVIRNAERLSVEGLAVAIGDLATRARNRRLHPDEVSGGTFTITNPGQFGAVLATPIINQPQVGILDLEAVVRRPVVVGSGPDEEIAIRPMSYLCMSWDHRALDGAVAARFLAGISARLEQGGHQ